LIKQQIQTEIFAYLRNFVGLEATIYGKNTGFISLFHSLTF